MNSQSALAELLRLERRALVAKLTRAFGLEQLALVEDALQIATLRALEQWPQEGSPENPAGWLFRVARNAALDALRHAQYAVALDDVPEPVAQPSAAANERFVAELGHDELALLFAACHPDLPAATQVALALRALCGFELSVIADGLLTTETALAQRLARARAVLRDSDLALPCGQALSIRREMVLSALALMFNVGWQSDAARARELCWDAIRLTRALAAHPAVAHANADALAATLLLHGARLTGRHDALGDIVPLPGQPRERWDGGMVRLGLAHMARAQRASVLSRWHLHCAIAAEHALAPDYAGTRWDRIVDSYALLIQIEAGAAPRLSHAIALAEAGDAVAAHTLLTALIPGVPDALGAHAYAALAHVLIRLGRHSDSVVALDHAIARARNNADRRLLIRRRAALDAAPTLG